MTSTARTAFPALVVMSLLLTACAGDPPSKVTPPSPTEATSPTATGWTPIAEDSLGDRMPPGRMGMTANGRPDAPWAVLDIPEGFSSIGGWVILDEENGGGVGYWTVSEVVREPCDPYSDDNTIDVGHTVEDLAAALQQQRLTRVSEPVPVSVDGYEGLALEVRMPRDLDVAACGDYNLWESDPAGARHMESPGEFDRLWMLDVDGEVVVLTVTDLPDDQRSSLDRLATMVESVEFVARD